MKNFFLTALSAEAVNLSPPDDEWTESTQTDEFKSYYQDSEQPETRKVFMTGVINASPKDCFDVVCDYENFPKIMPYIQFTKILHTKQRDEKTNITYVFFYLNPPMVANRFYTIELVDEVDPDGIQGAFRSKWDLEKGEHRKTPEDKEIATHVKKSFKAPIETDFNEGYWLFEPVDGGKKSKVSYYVWFSPGGAVPAKIADKANAIGMPKLWAALKEQLRKKKKLKVPKKPKTAKPAK